MPSRKHDQVAGIRIGERLGEAISILAKQYGVSEEDAVKGMARTPIWAREDLERYRQGTDAGPVRVMAKVAPDWAKRRALIIRDSIICGCAAILLAIVWFF